MNRELRKQEQVKELALLRKAGLTDRHLLILVALYYDGLTQEEVAPNVALTQQRVSQLHKEALSMLRSAGVPVPHKPLTTPRLRYFPGRDLERMG